VYPKERLDARPFDPSITGDPLFVNEKGPFGHASRWHSNCHRQP
jgi:hypothetical protein